MRIGVDLGGTKIEAIAIDDGGKELWRERLPTPSRNYPEILNSIHDLVSRAESKLAQRGNVGVGSPGAISYVTGLIKNSSIIVLNGKPLILDISRKLQRPIRLENDANCFTLSEAVDGAAADAHIVFGAILGTGVGGGLVIGKKLIAGRNRIAGEWGHNPLPWASGSEQPGPHCYCGKPGCIETFLSGTGLSRDYHSRSTKELPAKDVASEASQEGDKFARASLDSYRNRLARSLAGVINILDPDVIVLGGGLSNTERLYTGLSTQVALYTFSDGINTPIVPATHGDSSGVRGAACLWPPLFDSKS